MPKMEPIQLLHRSSFTHSVAIRKLIWVRLQDNANTCIKIGSFNLVVELAPVFTVVPVVALCDDLVQDGFTEFDLNLQNNIITGGDPTLSVTYYPTEVDAEAAINPLPLPYTNCGKSRNYFCQSAKRSNGMLCNLSNGANRCSGTYYCYA